MIRHLKIPLLLALLGWQANAYAQADVHPLLTDKFIVYAGGFFPNVNVDVGVDGTITGGNDDIDFEQDVGLAESDEIFELEFRWRFGKKWSLAAQFFSGSQGGTKTLDEDIEWGDVVFGQGTTISSATSIQISRLFVGRAFDTRPSIDAGIGLGLHRIAFDASVSGTIIVNGMQQSGEKRVIDAQFPLPNAGAWYSWSPSEKWALSGRIDWLDVTIGDYGGGIINSSVGANYQVFKHLGVGRGYQFFRLNGDVRKDNWKGDLKTRYSGAFLYLTANW